MSEIHIAGDYQYKALKERCVVRKFWYENKKRFLEEKAVITSSDVVLDAGCGSGNEIVYLSPRVRKVVGVDLNKDAIYFVQKQTRMLSISNIALVISDLVSLPIKSECFDKIILFEVLEHFDDKSIEGVLIELRRILKPQGTIFLTIPNHRSLWPVVEKILGLFGWVASLKEQHKIKFDYHTLKAIVSGKFRVIEMGSFNYFSPFLSIFSRKMAEWFFKREINSNNMCGLTLWCILEREGREHGSF